MRNRRGEHIGRLGVSRLVVVLIGLAALLAAVARADGGPQGYTNPNSAALAPNGSVIALEAATPADNAGSVSPGSPGRVFLVNPDGTALHQVVRLTGRMYDEKVVWLPNSSGFFFLDHLVRSRSTRISRYLIATHKLSSVTVQGDASAIAISGDGKTIAALLGSCGKAAGKDGNGGYTCLAIVNARTLATRVVDTPLDKNADPTIEFLPNNHTLVIAEPNEMHFFGTLVRTYDLRSGKFGTFFKYHAAAGGGGYNDITQIKLSPTHTEILYFVSGGPGNELRVASYPSNKLIWQQPTKKTFGDYYSAEEPAWSLSGDAVAFRWNSVQPGYPLYIAVWRASSGVRYYKLDDASDGNLNWLDATHIAWLESDDLQVLDLTSGQVTTTPYDKTLTQAAR